MSTAGPSQGANAPLGGSGPREAGERGGAHPTAGPSQGANAPLGGSGPREAGKRGGAHPTAGPSQGANAPLGGSGPREAGERGGARPTAGPSQGANAPLGGSGPREAGERGGARPTAGPPQGANAPLGGSGPREAGERGGARPSRVQRRPVHGVLLLDKPLGYSSNQALQKAKWLLRAEKAGHTGTLDPLASGVLPICFGAATKFSQLHLDADKTYETVIRLGLTTSTGDREGEVIETRPVTCSVGEVVEVLDRFTGPISQMPPMYSALKKDGKALYEYAREGRTVEREPRQVTIHDLELLDLHLQGDTPSLRLRVHCSKGTYIRTLGEDIAKALGCGGHLSLLRRVQTGPFAVSQCITVEDLQALPEDDRLKRLLPVDALLPGHTAVTLDSDNAGRFLSGLRRRGTWPDQARVAIYGPFGQTESAPVLLGSGHTQAGELIPGRLLSPIEIQQILEPAL